MAVAVAWHWQPGGYGFAVTELAYLAALVALAGQDRPDRRWLWLIGPVVIAEMLAGLSDVSAIGVLALSLLLSLLVVSIAWLAIDARLAVAAVAVLLGIWLPAAIGNLAIGIFSDLPFLGICAAVATPALWLLHRQSAHAGRPTQT